MGDLDIGTRTGTLPTEEKIVRVTVQHTELILNISTTIPC